MNLSGANGRNYTLRPSGSIRSYEHNGRRASLNDKGRLTELRTQNLSINRGALGEQRTRVRQPDGSNVVSYGPGSGYVDRGVVDHGHQYVVRVGVANGRTSTNVYQPLPYAQTSLIAFQPAVVYGPGFYDWFGTPWQSQVSYLWNWASSPAPGFYSSYYAPAPSSTSPAEWMSDYLMTSTLQDAYGARQTETVQAAGSSDLDEDVPLLASKEDAPITPEVRGRVVKQVSLDMTRERKIATAAASAPAGQLPELPQEQAAIIDPETRLFIVRSTLLVGTADQECKLTMGDTLLRAEAVRIGTTSTELDVQSSHAGECPKHAQVTISMRDLQEMNNHYKESLAAGEQTLSKGSGTPAPPAADTVPHPTTLLALNDPQQQAVAIAQIEQARNQAANEEAAMVTDLGGQNEAPR